MCNCALPCIPIYSTHNLIFSIDQSSQPKMEEAKERRRNMKLSPLCMPRVRGSTCTRKTNRPLSPLSLLDRIREAVFRLIMLSALSKATRESSRSVNIVNAHHPSYDHWHDPHQSAAVADCIEFIKKSATAEENGDSTASSSIDAATEVVLPVPVCET